MFDRSGNESNSAMTSPQEIRAIIRMLPSYKFIDGKFVKQLDRNGFPKLTEYSRTWNLIAYELNGSLTYEDMYQRLQNVDVQVRVPEAVELLARIPNPNKEWTTRELNTATAFYSAFGRDYIGIYSGYHDQGRSRFYFTEETRRNADNIARSWANNFSMITEDSVYAQADDVIYNEELDRMQINPNKKLVFNFLKRSDIEYFMDLLGISFSDITLSQPNVKKALPEFLRVIQDNINARLAANQVITNPILDLKSKFADVPSMNSFITAMARVEAQFSNEAPSMSFQTAEGEMIYGLSLRNFLSTSVAAINSAKTYQELIAMPEFAHYDYNKNPAMRYSLFLNNLFDLKTGQRRTITIDGKPTPNLITLGNYNGFKLSSTDGRKFASSTTNLNTRQKLILDINSLLTKGALDIMRTESSASDFFIKLTHYRNNSYLPIPIDNFATGFNSPAINRVMLNYLRMELDRMKNFSKVASKDVVASLGDAPKNFQIFRYILRSRDKNTESLKNKIKEALETKDVDTVISENEQEIITAIQDFFERDFRSFNEQLRADNITTGVLDENLVADYKNNFPQLMRAFIVNSFVLNTEFVTMFDGDLSYQAHYKDYFKRAKGDVSTGKTPVIDAAFGKFMRRVEKSTFAGFLGSAHLNDYRSFKTITIKDYKTTSSYADYGILAKNLKSVNPNITDEQINKIVSKYNDITVGDGQGHITLDFYRQFLISINNWSKEQEITYQKELAWFRINYAEQNPDYTDKQMQRDYAFINEHANVNSHFPPIKMQYNGPIDATGTFAKVLDKFSVAPLIPSMIRNTRWEQVNLDMIKNGISYSKFESGTKKYKQNPVDMYKGEGNVSIDFRDVKPATHYLTFLKEQINTQPKVKEESTFGSQVRKLIFSNLFDRGESSEKNINRKSRYIQLVRRVVDIEKEKLFNELGIAQENNRVVIKDLSKFIKTVQTQVELRDLNDNVKQYIQFDKDTKGVVHPLESSLNRAQIQDIFMGLIDNRLRKLKINGDQLIQISSAGFEKNDFGYKAQTEDDVHANGTNGLRFYELEYDGKGNPIRTKPMEVKVALIGGFERLLKLTHPDGNKIGTLDRINEMLRNPEWVAAHAESLTLIGYRIPTQGPNSIEFMQIKEFLPPSAGSSIILPAEIVVKAGSDFDIDKMFVFRPSIDENGRFFKADNLSTETNKNAITNSIIELFKEVMADPEMFEQLITPNSTDLVKPVSLEVAQALGKKSAKEVSDELKGKPSPYDGTLILRYMSSLRKFESLLSAKRLLGIFAVNNTFSQMIQQAGVKMNMTYGTDQKVKLFLLTPEERKLVLTEDGRRLDLSRSRAVNGVYKQEYFSQLINGTVDIASDDFLGYVNLSMENAGVLSLLINQGVPFDRALWFINQPILLEYYANLRSQSGTLRKAEIVADILEKYGETGLFSETGRVKNKTITDKVQQIINNRKLPAGYHFSLAYLKKAANRKEYRELYNASNAAKRKQLDDSQKTIFAYFLSLQEQARGFQDFRSVLNYDTTKFGTPLDVVASHEKEKSLTSSRSNGLALFTTQDVVNVNTKTAIAPFSNKLLIWDISRTLMPIGYGAQFLTLAAKEVAKMFNSKKNIQKVSKTMMNEFIEFIIKNLGVSNGIPLRNYFDNMMYGKNSMAKRLVAFKKKYPSLYDRYALVERLRVNFDVSRRTRMENIEVKRLFENTTSDQNRYISEFRELINFSDNSYSVEEQKEIQMFFKDLALFSFLQSGFNKSNISFQDLVPFEELTPIFDQAMEDYKNKIKSNELTNQQFITEFLNKFKSINAGMISKFASYGYQTWRGKDYRVSIKRFPEVVKQLPKYEQPKANVPKVSVPKVVPTPKPVEVPKVAPVVKPKTEVTEDRTQEIIDIFRTQREFASHLNKFRTTDKMVNDMLKAQMQIWSENISSATGTNIVEYIKLEPGLNQEQIDDIFVKLFEKEDKSLRAKYLAKLTPETFPDMLKYYDNYGDDILNQDGEIELDSVMALFGEVSAPIRGSEYIYESISDAMETYLLRDDRMQEDEVIALENLFKKYNLMQYTGNPDYLPPDPNQLKMFSQDDLDKLNIKPNCS